MRCRGCFERFEEGYVPPVTARDFSMEICKRCEDGEKMTRRALFGSPFCRE